MIPLKALSVSEEHELESIRNEVPEEFVEDEPLSVPFECEHCSFETINSRDAATHAEFHNDLLKMASRWEPSVVPIPISVIVSNPLLSS